MFSRRLVLALVSQSLLAGGLVGCQQTPKPEPAPLPPVASVNDAEHLQTQLQQRDPGAGRGLLSGSMPLMDWRL